MARDFSPEFGYCLAAAVVHDRRLEDRTEGPNVVQIILPAL